MKKVTGIFTVLLLVYCLFALSACGISYDSMLQDFNKSYFSPEPEKERSVNDDDFEADKMLELAYDFYEGYASSLVAPADAASYSWTTPKSNTKPVEYKELCKERIYNFMPGKDFAVGSEIKVILTVTNTAGAEYIDSTIVRINRELPI